MYCNKCGKNNVNGVVYCWNCGAAIMSSERAQLPPTAKVKPRPPFNLPLLFLNIVCWACMLTAMLAYDRAYWMRFGYRLGDDEWYVERYWHDYNENNILTSICVILLMLGIAIILQFLIINVKKHHTPLVVLCSVIMICFIAVLFIIMEYIWIMYSRTDMEFTQKICNFFVFVPLLCIDSCYTLKQYNYKTNEEQSLNKKTIASLIFMCTSLVCFGIMVILTFPCFPFISFYILLLLCLVLTVVTMVHELRSGRSETESARQNTQY